LGLSNVGSTTPKLQSCGDRIKRRRAEKVMQDEEVLMFKQIHH